MYFVKDHKKEIDMNKKTFTIIGVIALIIGAVMLLLGGNSE